MALEQGAEHSTAECHRVDDQIRVEVVAPRHDRHVELRVVADRGDAPSGLLPMALEAVDKAGDFWPVDQHGLACIACGAEADSLEKRGQNVARWIHASERVRL